jgi:diguanylate cyclase (GGDEF)-like protein/PAS domain S-box-containing protein
MTFGVRLYLRAAISRFYAALARGTVQLRTIRGRILVAFLIMSVITVGLGAYAIGGLRRAGDMVTKTFDESLMSINYARAAATDFAAMRAAFADRRTTSDPERRQKLDQAVDALWTSLTEDLAIAAERSQSTRAALAAERVRDAASTWTELRRKANDNTAPETWTELDNQAAIIDQQIDFLVNYTAGDAFTYRLQARAAVAAEIRLNIIGTILALVLSGLVAWLLARRIIGPVAAASGAAERIAAGDLNGEVPKGSADELGALLAAMGVMRENIKSMVQREVSERRSAQAYLAGALECSREGVAVIDKADRIVLANSQLADFLGASPEVIKPGAQLVAAAAESTDARAALIHADEGSSTPREVCLSDGRWLRVSRSAVRDGGSIVVCSDITVLKTQEANLRATNLRLDAALDNMSQGLCLYDSQNRLQLVNRRYFEIFGLSAGQLLPGITFREVLELSTSKNQSGEDVSHQIDVLEEFVGRQSHGIQFQQLKDGRVVAMAHQSMPDAGWVATYEDVTERRHAEARIAFMARHDALTNLPNRILFADRVEEAISHMGRGSGFAIHCLDLDYFKQVNDSLGHAIGDELLRQAAERLQSCAREIDTVARLGGDEFAIVQRDIAGAEDAAVLARRVVEVISAPYRIDGQKLTVGVSVGISLAPADGSSCERLLKNADLALYRAKSERRGVWRFFELEMDARLQSRRSLELDLREAIANRALVIHYQPIYDVDGGGIGGFEALLRWQHSTRGSVPPSEFIPIAEEIGLISSIGEWVVNCACEEASRWPPYVKLAVNVSPAQFVGDGLIQSVADALAKSGLPGNRLEIEITESVLLAKSRNTFSILNSLRDKGVQISLDDFGTGYSSLSYLRSFPVDKIKIDRSFIHGLGTPDGSDLIVRAIIGLGHSLGMRTTAEGVESEVQLDQLRFNGCDEAQGYLFSPAVAPQFIPELLTRWNKVGTRVKRRAGKRLQSAGASTDSAS